MSSSRIIPRIGVAFSPAGLLTPFHLGVAHQLSQPDSPIFEERDKIALAGASGGALAATIAALNIDINVALNSCGIIARKCRDEGTRLTLRTSLDEVLQHTLPNNSHTILQDRKAPCIIAYTQLLPKFKSQLVQNFSDKDDLISALRASCNIPFYFNGFNPVVKVRDGFAIDGFFAVDIARFGTPSTSATFREIIVSPFPNKITGLHLLNDDIEDYSSPYPNFKSDDQLRFDVISPDLLNSEYWPFNFQDILAMAFGPPPTPSVRGKSSFDLVALVAGTYKDYEGASSNEEIEETYRILFNAGVEATKVWYKNQDWHVHQ
eukprot:gene10617-14258_t